MVRKLSADLSGKDASLSYTQAMRQLASGVSIVTVGAGSARTGFTATSVVSLSADPPRVLVSVDRTRAAYAEIARCSCFGVSILASHHESVAAKFASKECRGEARFVGECWHTMATGASLLCDALAVLDCEVEEIIERHTHGLIIGRVVAAFGASVGDALLYWRGDYHDRFNTETDRGPQWSPILQAPNVGCG